MLKTLFSIGNQELNLICNLVTLCCSMSCIGALFDQDSLQAHTAFRYEIEKHNNRTDAVFKINRYEKIIDVSDSYQLIKSSE